MSLIFRAAGAYFILLMSVRLMGRRTASQMAPMDLVMLFLFGGVSITAVLGEDHSMVGAFTGIGTIGLMHVAVSGMKSHSDWFRTLGRRHAGGDLRARRIRMTGGCRACVSRSRT